MVRKRRPRNVKIVFPSTITSFSLVIGFVAILVACDGKVEKACYLLMLSILMDGLDGKVARMTNTASEFGIQYDSMADVVAFGVTPCVIYSRYFLYQQKESIFYLLPMMFLVCGAIRLARFNITASIYGKSFFTGLPIPAAAFMVALWPPLLRWVEQTGFPEAWGLNAYFAKESIFQFSIVLMIVLSWSMISTVKFDTPGGFWLRKFPKRWMNYAVLTAFLLLNFIHHTVFFLGISAYYLFSMFGRVIFEKIRKNGDVFDVEENEAVASGGEDA